MNENKNNKKVILNEFISRIRLISHQIGNRLFEITEEDLIFIKNTLTKFLDELVNEML